MARLADVPVREVDACCWRPLEELLERCEPPDCCVPELDSPCEVSPEDLEPLEVLAVCVVPVPCASPPDEVLELDELVVLLELLLELLVLELVLLDELLLDELLLDGSAAVVVLLDDEELVLAVCVLLEDVDEDEDSGAELVDEVLVLDGWELAVDVVLELVDDDVSLGAVLAVVVVDVLGALVLLELAEVVGALVAAPPVSAGADVAVDVGALETVEVVAGLVAVTDVVGAVVVVVGAEAMVTGELIGALRDVEKLTVAGATLEAPLLVVVELLVDEPLLVAAVCVAVCTAACPAVTAVCTVGFETGLPRRTELNVPCVVGGATTVVGTTGPVRVQLEAVPARVKVLVTATWRPLTGVLLESVADEALTGPPAAMVDAVSESALTPASIVPGVSVPKVVRVIPPAPVAVTVPEKLLLRLGSEIALLPAWRFVAPVTAIGPVCVTFPLEVSERLPALTLASVVAEPSTSVTVPVVFTATVPKFALPEASVTAPPLFAVKTALPPTLRTSPG